MPSFSVMLKRLISRTYIHFTYYKNKKVLYTATLFKIIGIEYCNTVVFSYYISVNIIS